MSSILPLGVPYLAILRYVQSAITTTALNDSRADEWYSQQLFATRGSAPYSWSLASGALPSGLTLDSSTGVISGMPWRSGTYTVPLLVTDAGGVSDVISLGEGAMSTFREIGFQVGG